MRGRQQRAILGHAVVNDPVAMTLVVHAVLQYHTQPTAPHES